MRMMLACGGVPVLLGLFLERSLHFGVDIWSCHPTQEGNDGPLGGLGLCWIYRRAV